MCQLLNKILPPPAPIFYLSLQTIDLREEIVSYVSKVYLHIIKYNELD